MLSYYSLPPSHSKYRHGSIARNTLVNVTVANVPCTDFPCCLRVICNSNNAGDCSNLIVTSQYMDTFEGQPISEISASSESNYSTVNVVAK